MKIADIEIKGALLAPMAGYTDAGFRAVCSLCGAGAVFTEMVSAKGLIYDSEKTKDLLYTTPAEKVSCAQIFGADPYFIRAACEHKIMDKFALIDINMGCPVPKIVKNKEGSALMLDPALAERVVKEAVKSKRVITVKCRTGFYDSLSCADFVKRMQDAGASAVTVHGRTREQFYAGRADMAPIKKAVESVDIPVIANGDIKDKESAEKALKETGAAGVAIGRGALGNPFVFAQFCRGNASMTAAQALDLHIKILTEIYPEKKVVNDMKKHIAFYVKGRKGGKEIKLAAFKAQSLKELEEIIRYI